MWNSRPRHRSAAQQFMQDYPKIVKDAFALQYGDGKGLTSAQRMNNKHEVAKDLLHREYSHLISDLESKAESQNSAEVEEWELVLEDISLARDVTL